MAFGAGGWVLCLGHEGEVLVNEITALIKETQESPLSLPPCEEGIVRSPQSAGWMRVFPST